MRLDEVPWAWCAAPEPPAPPLRDLARRDAAGRAARLHHLTHRAQGWGQEALLAGLGLLRPATAARVAERGIGPLARRANARTLATARMNRTVRRLRPDLDAVGRAALLDRWFGHVAQSLTAYPRLPVLAGPGHTRTDGIAHLEGARAAGRPVIFAGVHTGAWELGAPIAHRDMPGGIAGPWQPQPNRYDNRLVERMRRRMGIRALPPSPHLARRLARLLRDPAQGLLIMVDEIADPGGVLFPRFGRPAPRRCNASFALRLAQSTGAAVVPLTIVRTGPARYAACYHAPVDVGPGADGLAAGFDALEDVLGAHVLAHLDQWYMLQAVEPDAFSPRAGRRPAAR